MARLLYVASRPHAGSTLFTMMMAHHPRAVGLGGIDRAVRMILSEPDRTAGLACTCGRSARDCPYWGAVFVRAHENKLESLAQRYELALSVFTSVFGENAWAVDAGQHKEPLYALVNEKWLDLRVIHLVRDVRSAIVSDLDQRQRHGKGAFWQAIPAVEIAWRWWRENEKIERCLRATHLPNRTIGYEEICLNFPEVFRRVIDFLDLPPAEAGDEVPRSNSHMFIGNRMRKQEEKRRLLYDGRWFTRREWVLPTLLLPFLLERNERWVYGNKIFDVFTRQ